MKTKTIFLATLVVFFSLAPSAWAQSKVRINWTAVTGAQSGVYVAKEEGLFKKNGLDVELIHIPSSSRGIQAILAGEIAFSYGQARDQEDQRSSREEDRHYQGWLFDAYISSLCTESSGP